MHGAAEAGGSLRMDGASQLHDDQAVRQTGCKSGEFADVQSQLLTSYFGGENCNMLTGGSTRSDLSGHLIHFTKDAGNDTAFEVLIRILRERSLRGSTSFVRGGTKCISLTEAPIATLA